MASSARAVNAPLISRAHNSLPLRDDPWALQRTTPDCLEFGFELGAFSDENTSEGERAALEGDDVQLESLEPPTGAASGLEVGFVTSQISQRVTRPSFSKVHAAQNQVEQSAAATSVSDHIPVKAAGES